MKGLYFGVVSFLTAPTSQHNEFMSGWAESRGKFVDAMKASAKADYGVTDFVNVTAYRIDDATVKDAAVKLG